MLLLAHSYGWPADSVWLTVVAPILQFVLFLRWLHRRMRNDEITRAFVRDIATNQASYFLAGVLAGFSLANSY